MYKYETHLHTSPVSKCASRNVYDSLKFYKEQGYDGVFITNHFLDGNINIDYDAPYAEKINFYFSDYEKGVEIGKELGIKVFAAPEISYGGTDFLVFGLDKQWYLEHPEIMQMSKSEELAFLRKHGAFISHAHPYREAGYIDHIRLYPRLVDAAEVINANRTPLENKMAKLYAKNYGLYQTAGSDNHIADGTAVLAGMMSETPVNSVEDFIAMVKAGQFTLFFESRENK